jgi:calcium/calmodulin-dependent protein kinase I
LFVFRDIKPENLILMSDDDDACLKIADFGLAAKLSPEVKSLTNPCGTPGYAAPEIIRGNGYSKPVDMWALGVVTFCLLGGYPPFEGENVDDLFDNVLMGNYHFHEEFWSAVSSQAKDFIRGLLNISADTRMTAEQALRHPWVNPVHRLLQVTNVFSAAHCGQRRTYEEEPYR